MNKLFIAIASVILFASCTAGANDTNQLPLITKKVRAYELYENAYSYVRLDQATYVIHVDTSYHTGDTIEIRRHNRAGIFVIK